MSNYTLYHLHSDLSNAVTNIDSVTKYNEYIAKASQCGMTALAFAEHGSVMEWWHKKCDIEKAGMKYIHAVEMYITETMDDKIRDNMHCVLIARNKDGAFEINRLVSKSFNRKDNHYYYVPRISVEELFSTSENILITSACVGGLLAKSEGELHDRLVDFFARNSHRCFLEIGHHPDPKQVAHNQYLDYLSRRYGIPLIAGTDTHCLNEDHVRGRSMLQRSKKIHFDNEDSWDLCFRTYDELVEAYRMQNSLSEDSFMQAIENTNVMAGMVEPFEIDRGTKYPHIYDDPVETFKKQIEQSVDNHKYLLSRYDREQLMKELEEERAVYEKCQSIDFMLLQKYLRDWEHENGIWCGPGRGSVSGSQIAYTLGITEMDSKKFNLNFFRFMNPSRVTNCDIDTDYGGPDRDIVKQFLLRDHMNLPQIKTSEIITFNTIAEKGAIRDIGRALEIPLSEIAAICKKIDSSGCVPEKIRQEYDELFEYVDIVSGTIVSIGTHPSGVLVSDLDIESIVGMCSTGQSPYPVSMLNMKELDDLMFVKLDILGLDNILVINEACRLAGIERLTPDNTDLEDMAVWKSIRDDTTGIFQWSSNSAQQYIRKFMSDKTIAIAREKIPNFSMLKWMSFGNGLLRPACASYRDEVAEGRFFDNGFKELNEFLAPEAGRVCMQETIMQFLVKFCGYSAAESDNVRRAIAKKKGTETLLPEIENRFIEYSSAHYDITKERCAEVIKPFLQTIQDASSYAFSWNHSDSYSCIGYICGYLRYYYPYEFIAASANAFSSDSEQLSEITTYAMKHNIKIMPPRYGSSKADYVFDKDNGVITKGIASLKHLNVAVSDQLYEMSKTVRTDSFIELLGLMRKNTSINSRQLENLIKIGYFNEFGNTTELLRLLQLWDWLKQGTAKKISKDKLSGVMLDFVKEYGSDTNAKGEELKQYTITDMPGLLNRIERYVLDEMQLKEVDYRVMAQNQLEILGYVDMTTGKKEDRMKLYILECFTIENRWSKKGGVWKYKLKVKSLGSGNVASLDLDPNLMKRKPVQVGDIIHCLANPYKDEKGYWHLVDYTVL